MKDDIVITNGGTFLICDTNGFIGTKPHHGVYANDTRFLSTYELLIDGVSPELLTSQSVGFSSASFYHTNRGSKHVLARLLTIVQNRAIDQGYHQDLTITNNSLLEISFIIAMRFGVDFADLFEVKKGSIERQLITNHAHEVKTTAENNTLEFKYKRGDFSRKTSISFSKKDAYITGNTVRFTIKLSPKESWHTCVLFSFASQLQILYASKECFVYSKSEKPALPLLKNWGWDLPELKTDWDDLHHIFTKSLTDLASLQMQGDILGKKFFLPAAGIPWFVAMFGRDSLVTCYQTLLFGEGMTKQILRSLALLQGKEVVPEKEEEPGKILHEMRFGEAAYFNEWVQFPYYGSADSTPLFLILLSEFYQWTKDKSFVNELKPHVLLALSWVDKYGDIDNDGFVEYNRKLKKGLYNQNWRDSADSMVFQSGRVALTPIASCDVQGYVYDAKIRISKIAKDVWQEKNLAEKLEKEAKNLKEQFNKSFWINNRGFFALGLDRDKKQIDSLSSSIGHLLLSGIVEDSKIPFVVQHLMDNSLYNGWGVRTISSDSNGYNPLKYHRGTVWPHDNSLIADGLLKCGYKKEAMQIIENLIYASTFFDYRLPEVFAGFSKKEAPFPVVYPTASSPQAWASATPLLFLRLLLGLQPDPKTKTLHASPIFPKELSYIKLGGICAFGKHFVVEADRSKVEIIPV